MISIVVALALSTAASPMTDPAAADVTAARAWVDLLDAQRWDQSWAAAGTLFKSQMTEPRWATTVQPVREPLGPVASRSLKSVTRTNSLPGAPDGEYEVIQFQTSFAHKSDAVETVVLAREASGWKVDGYFIR